MLLYEMITLSVPYGMSSHIQPYICNLFLLKERFSGTEIRKKVLAGDRPPIQGGQGQDIIPLISLFEECTALEPSKRIPLNKVKKTLVEMMT